ncbi:MAG: trypsin-like peptidase domain-containing protein [Cyanobacteria bacterium P01_A01_bin.37]
MEFEASKRAIAQIHFADFNTIAGTGFLVAEGYVLTCAHVVKEALRSPEHVIGSELSVTFFNTTQPHQATVIFYEFEQHDSGRDAALLYLSAMPKLAIEAIPLCPLSQQQLNDAALRVFGFLNGDRAGRNLTAVTRGETSGGWVQIEDTKAPGLAIESGFSGSPVWCDASQSSVGMVVARHVGQDDAKVGFMIPVQKLQIPLQALKKHALLEILVPHHDALSEQITTAYKVCRPDTWSEPFENELEHRLADMALMSSGKLVEFAACLWNQPRVDPVRTDLIAWIERYKSEDKDLAALLKQMEERQQQVAPQHMNVVKPCLLIRIQADKATKKEPYQVDGWLVPNSTRYNAETREGYEPKTGEGAETLKLLNWQKYLDIPESEDLTDGVRYEHLPALIADYLDQVARRNIRVEDLTIEFFLPLPLINQAIEQCPIPVEYGFPAPLGIEERCPHVVIRSQERLDFARGLKQWETKWNRLQDELHGPAIDAFVDGNELTPKRLQNALASALGLKLTKKLPKASNQGEIGVLLATGTPAAVWIRCPDSPHLAASLDTTILNCCLERVPDEVFSLRRETSELDEDVSPLASSELGHHLSFLWEDFYRVPPNITYSHEKL